MLKITIPFTNEIVLDTAEYRENELDELVINQFDEVRETLGINIKTLLAQDIAVFMISLNCPESVLINIQISSYTRVMNFILSGMLNVYDSEKGNFALLGNTYHSFTATEHSSRDIVISGQVELFIVCLNADAIDKLIPAEETDILQNTNIRLTTPDMDELIDPIIRYTRVDSLQRILLVARIIELLFLDLEQIKKSNARQIAQLVKPADKRKLEEARTLIAENLQAPCSLIELAHKVGLNDFKLKKGFKELFGTTVFGYLSDLRMDKAKKMLSSAQYTVGEVATEVGYKNPHHFTAAFKKKFGQLPSKTGITGNFINPEKPTLSTQ